MCSIRNRGYFSTLRPESAPTLAGNVLIPAVCAIALAVLPGAALAADVTWDNGSSNFMWDTTSANWNTGPWNNAAGDGAIFGAAGVGTLSLAGPINVNSFDFSVDGYSLTGVGPLNIVSGVSTQTTGVANVATGATAKVFVPINSSLGFQKIGAGTLELNNPCSIFGGIPLTANGLLRTDLLVGGATGPIASGMLRLNAAGVLPSSTRVSIANGLLDIGSNNVTLSELTFVNQTTSTPWNPVTNAAAAGVIGSGTLRVLGDINVIGVSGGNQSSNTIAANLDLGGGTQVVRVGLVSSIGLSAAMQFTGTISNGSLLKTIGFTTAGVQGSIDGMGLFGNNTYTGATIINSGTNVATGTNASTSIKIAGIAAGPAGGSFSLQGANGSFQSATLIQAVAGGTFILDNNAALGASGNNQPNIPAAQNNDRIRDDAEMQLRDGNFTYRGRSALAGSETFGSLNLVGGHNLVTLTPNGGGTVTVTASGNLSIAPRATLQVSSTTLGAASKLFVNGTLPAADATGILPRMVGSSDFLTYNGATGLTPYTGYATDFSTPGTNVSVTAASTVNSSVTINALKRGTTSFTTTIAAGETLGISSGMILNAGGTGTFSGGTIAFGATPGVLFGGTNSISSAITGTAGLINANSTTTLTGDLSGLSGGISTNNGTTNLNTNTYTGALDVRAGTLSLGVPQTGAGLGAITLGVSANDSNLVGLVPTLSFGAAGANAVINRDIIVDNGAWTAAGVELGFSTVARLSPLSNLTGSQTISGNLVLNSPLNLQGGGGGGTGSTNFTGSISGPATFYATNGRASFSGNVSNAGGFLIGNTGFTAPITFSGTGSGMGPIRLNGGSGAGSTSLSYTAGALPGGLITVQNAVSNSVSLVPLNNSTIGNAMFFNGTANAVVNTGITAEWAGTLAGSATLTKSGLGTLILSNPFSTYNGPIGVNAGTLQVDGSIHSAITVATAAILDGTGIIGGSVAVNAGAILAPGTSIGTLNTGDLTVLGIVKAEIDMNSGTPSAADLLAVQGSITLNGATLDLALLNDVAPPYFNGTFLLIANDGSFDPVTGVFATITGLPLGYAATIDYSFLGTDSLGRIGNGNDIAITLTPEPISLVLFGAVASAQLFRRRRR